MAHRVGQGQDGEAEGQRHTGKADAELDPVWVAQELRGEHGTTAATEDEPERAEELGAQPGGKLGGIHFAPTWKSPECVSLTRQSLLHESICRQGGAPSIL